jgi:hypothetical protein
MVYLDSAEIVADAERLLYEQYIYSLRRPTPTKPAPRLDREGALTLAVISTSVLVGIIIGLLGK